MCYNHSKEVIFVENQEPILNEEELTEVQEEVIPTKQGYTERPKYQVWLARLGLVVFIFILVIYYMVYFRGGR